MPWPSVVDWAYASLAVGLCQLLVALRFYFLLRREFAATPVPHTPAVSVLIPCKGSRNLREHAAFLLQQEYTGELEFLFIVPSQNDPAYAELEKILSEARDSRCRLFCSNALPVRCSEQILNLLFGLQHISPKSQVLLFADSDLQVPRQWVSHMVSPLKDSEIGVTNTAMLYVPKQRGIWGLLRMLWVGIGVPYFEWLGGIAGHSFAMRKKDFEDLGVSRLWQFSLSHDLSLARKVRQWGKKIHFVGRAMPVCEEPCDFRGFLTLFNKWIILFRTYDKRIWGMGALLTLGKTCMWVWALWPPVFWPLIGLLLGMDAAYGALVFRSYGRFLPERFVSIHPAYRNISFTAFWATPFLQAAYLVHFLNSLWTRTMAWGGYKYRIHGPQNIEVLKA